MSPREAALHILHQLRAAGHTAYLAGGCVRDLLLGLEPKDFDIATSASPSQIQQLFRNTQSVGAAFGVILVRHAGHQVEVATFRSDGPYSDGRRPDGVRFATPEEDARRRDFTLNGLFLDPPESPTDSSPGRIIDFVGGQADLAARILRAIGDPDQRFTEDHLRLLRAVRFAARFDLTFDPATAAAIRRNAPHLRRIAPERVGDELRRMLTPPTRARAWSLLRDFGLTAELFRYCDCPDRPALSLVPHLPDVEVPFPLALAAAAIEESAHPQSDPDHTLLAALHPDHAATTHRGLRQALRLSNEESDAMCELLSSARRLLEPLAARQSPTVAARRRVLALAHADDLLRLLGAILAAGHFTADLPPLLDDLTARIHDNNAPPPLLTGDHLTAAGLRPGPVFRKLLDAAYDAQLEGRLTTPEQALAFALAHAPPNARP